MLEQGLFAKANKELQACDSHVPKRAMVFSILIEWHASVEINHLAKVIIIKMLKKLQKSIISSKHSDPAHVVSHKVENLNS